MALVGCAATRDGIIRAANSYDDFFAPIEGLPVHARALQKATLNEVLAGGPGWREYEIGRRFEVGGGGLPRDEGCALLSYEVAAHSPYKYLDWSGATGPRPTKLTCIGVPFARIALRRLRHEDQPGARSLAPASAAKRSSPGH